MPANGRRDLIRRLKVKLIKRSKANWLGNVLRRNCQLKHVMEGKIEGIIEAMGRRRRESKQLLVELKERRGYWKLKEETFDCSL